MSSKKLNKISMVKKFIDEGKYFNNIRTHRSWFFVLVLESLIIQNGSVSPDIDEKVRQAAIISSFT